MSPLQAAVLGAIQGVTEFLPISSSAHLFLVPSLLGWEYGGLAFDVALHGGTLLALVLAFWRDWRDLARGAWSGEGETRVQARRTWLQIALASVPAAVACVLLVRIAENTLRSVPLQCITLVVFGALLWAVDLVAPHRSDRPGWPAVIGMGLAQAISLVPGVSRSGITMTAGRAAGLTRVAAARFSFLLAPPITLGALLLKLRDLPDSLPLVTIAIGVTSSTLVGIVAIRGLLRWLSHAGFGWFFAYRVALAAFTLLVAAR